MKVLLTALALFAVALSGCTEDDPDRAQEPAHDHSQDHAMEGTDATKADHQALVAAAGDYPVDFQKAVTMSGHAHAQTEITAGQYVPSIDVEVIPDPLKAGQYNLHIMVDGFRFAPQNVSTAPQYGEGHTHVYVDDVLVARAYGEYFHLAFMKPGEHTVKVTLNQNDHSEYSLNGESIFATVDFTVPEPSGNGMMHGHS